MHYPVHARSDNGCTEKRVPPLSSLLHPPVPMPPHNRWPKQVLRKAKGRASKRRMANALPRSSCSISTDRTKHTTGTRTNFLRRCVRCQCQQHACSPRALSLCAFRGNRLCTMLRAEGYNRQTIPCLAQRCTPLCRLAGAHRSTDLVFGGVVGTAGQRRPCNTGDHRGHWSGVRAVPGRVH